MVINRKPTGRASSVPAGLAYGWVAFMTVLFAGIAGLASLINGEKISMTHMGYGIMAVLMVGAWSGAMISNRRIKRNKMIVCLSEGVICFITLLLITALFFGAKYSAVGETGLLIFCGSMMPCFGGRRRKTKAGQGKFRIPNG